MKKEITFETPLHKAQGLGSAKSGLHHWIAQRVTALALIPLSIWFVGMMIFLIGAPFEETQSWMASPWTATFLILFVFLLFYHGSLGMQVIWEDYISPPLTQWLAIIVTHFLSTVMAVVAILSIMKVYLSL